MSDVEAIDWQSLATCYGFGTEIPQWLRQLASPDSGIRQDAIERLTAQIYHQGSIYEATPQVVPFLVELLAEPSIRDKHNILGLLWLLMSARPLPEDKLLRSLLEGEGRDFDREMALSKSYVMNTIGGIRRGLPVYFALLDDENPSVRIETANLLSVLLEDKRAAIPRLLSQVQKETDADAKATAIWALSVLLEVAGDELSRERIQYMEVLSRLIASSESLLVRFISSASQLKMAGNHGSPEAVEMLVDAASRPEKYPKLPWGDVVQWTACESLAELRGNKRVATFERLIAAAPRGDDAQTIAIVFLNRVFRGKDARIWDLGIGFDTAEDGRKVRSYTTNYEIPAVRKLNVEQRAILRAVAKSDKFWEIHNNLLEAYGLPASREQLQRYLANATN